MLKRFSSIFSSLSCRKKASKKQKTNDSSYVQQQVSNLNTDPSISDQDTKQLNSNELNTNLVNIMTDDLEYENSSISVKSNSSDIIHMNEMNIPEDYDDYVDLTIEKEIGFEDENNNNLTNENGAELLIDPDASEILSPRISRSQIIVFKNQHTMSGSYGLVKKGKLYLIGMKRLNNNSNQNNLLLNKKYIATKRLSSNKLIDKNCVNSFINEISILKSCSHDNVVRFIGVVFVNKSKFYIVTELCDSKDLNQWISDNQFSNWYHSNILDIIDISLGIANGISYLHSNSIVHRDIKSANVLMFKNRLHRLTDIQKPGLYVIKWIPKISDFGFAISVKHGYKKHYLNPNLQKLRVGTLEWMAPEIQNSDPYDSILKLYTTKIDVYAFGVVLYELIKGTHPYVSMDRITFKESLKKKRLHFNEVLARCDAPIRLIDLMWICTSYYAKNRPHFRLIVHEIEKIKMNVYQNRNFSLNTKYELKFFKGFRRLTQTEYDYKSPEKSSNKDKYSEENLDDQQDSVEI